ncbi:MAG: polyphosphate kinase 2 family protein [Gemmatimonadales bacterium]|nr:polyphosphate kinase 2 family protein [Gemmatimonadales bacterium]
MKIRLDPVPPGVELALDDADASVPDRPSKDRLRERFDELATRFQAVQPALYADGSRGMLVVLQGRDASGKDGVVSKVFGLINPQGFTTRSFGVPEPHELRHDYLWRVHNAVGPRGSITVFNRSHYEDVLVVRVRQLVQEAVWARRFDQINAFERMLTDNGYAVLKFFLHVSRAEQGKRLEERLDDPEKNWKFRLGDLDDRARWDDFTLAYRDAIARCSTVDAPWFVVPADEKRYRDVLVLDTVVRTLEEMHLTFPGASAEVLARRGTIA